MQEVLSAVQLNIYANTLNKILQFEVKQWGTWMDKSVFWEVGDLPSLGETLTFFSELKRMKQSFPPLD